MKQAAACRRRRLRPCTGLQAGSTTGLCYLGARYYSPEDGRMITPDDAAYAFPGGLSGLNLYAYCLDNPETFEDISGNFPSWIRAAGHFLSSVCTVSGAVGGAVTAALGVSLGRYFNAIDPFRATAVAAFSSAAGAFISAGGGRGGASYLSRRYRGRGRFVYGRH